MQLSKQTLLSAKSFSATEFLTFPKHAPSQNKQTRALISVKAALKIGRCPASTTDHNDDHDQDDGNMTPFCRIGFQLRAA